MQFVVDERQQSIERIAVAVLPLLQQLGDRRVRAHRWFGSYRVTELGKLTAIVSYRFSGGQSLPARVLPPLFPVS